MEKSLLKLILTILRYLIPAVIGWIEGDSHLVVDSISALISLF